MPILYTSEYGRPRQRHRQCRHHQCRPQRRQFHDCQGSGSFTNQGTINVSNGTLSADFDQLVEQRHDCGDGRDAGPSGNGLTLAQLGTVTHTGGTVNLQTGTLDDTGTTLECRHRHGARHADAGLERDDQERDDRRHRDQGWWRPAGRCLG